MSEHPGACPACFRQLPNLETGLGWLRSCPHCGHEIPCQRYELGSDDLFVCPDCRRKVRLEFNPDLFNADGSVNSPVVLTHDAQG